MTAKQCPSTLMLVNGTPPKKGEFTEEQLKMSSLLWVYCTYTTDQEHEEHTTAGLIDVGRGVGHMYWKDGDDGVFSQAV